MVLIVDNPTDPLIEQIYTFIEAEAAKEPPRNYIGASSIGDNCERKLYYKLRNAKEAAPRRAELILAANDGHRSEDLIASYIRQIPGVELWTHKSDGGQYGFAEKINDDVNFKGHLDGIIKGLPQAPVTPHVWENKCCNQKKYDELLNIKQKYGEKNALERWNYQYYCQAVINMHKFELTRHYTTVALSGSRKLQSMRTEANPVLAELLTTKAHRVGNAQEPPIGISQNPTYFECKHFCEFYNHCFKGKI